MSGSTASASTPVAVKLADLVTNDAVKLVPIRHYGEPTAAEVLAEDKAHFERWTSYAKLRRFVEKHWEDYDNANRDRDGDDLRLYNIPVGTLDGTEREVYAEFAGDTFDNGVRRITLIAGPFVLYNEDEHDLMIDRLASEEALTDQHGSTGFMAAAEIQDWNIVTFLRDYRSSHGLVGSFGKISAELDKGPSLSQAKQWRRYGGREDVDDEEVVPAGRLQRR
jgi:hypothetical protein